MLPNWWKPVEAGGLIRIGPQHDGGYIVSERALAASDTLLSFGLSDDWQFEEAFQRMSGARVICLDHTVNWKFWVRHIIVNLLRLRWKKLTRYFEYLHFFSNPNTEHRALKVGYDRPGEISLKSLIDLLPGRSIFLKSDIEGAEYRLLDTIISNAGRFTGLAIEFHDIDLHRARLEDFIDRLKGFVVVSLHANNAGGVDGNGDPLVIEMSFVRKDLFEPAQPGGKKPSLAPNDPNAPDIEIVYS